MEKLSRSGYFVGALLLHLIIFILVATWVVFPAFHPPQDSFGPVSYVPPSVTPPMPPPSDPVVHLPSQGAPVPTPIIVSTGNPNVSLPVPGIGTGTAPIDGPPPAPPTVVVKPDAISPERLKKILDFEKALGRTPEDIASSNSDPRNITAKFPVYLASYADGDWDCNVHLKDGKIDAGSLPDLVAKMNEWSHGHITGEVVPTPLNIGGPDLLDKQPPFIFFTGHKDFVLTDREIQNLRDYLQIGGAIWGDNAMPGRGSRFDVAFRREMKRVVPDRDKDFVPMAMDDDVFAKSWFPISKLPEGMNYYSEPAEHLDIDGRLAILYTPNDYSDLLCMRILPGDTQMQGAWPDPKSNSALFTSGTFLSHGAVYFRNFELSSCLACDRFGMNVIGYLLVRFDKDLILAH